MKTVDDIIDAIGGNAKAAELVGVGSSAVSNWRSDEKIPAAYFLKFSQELGKLPWELFGFKL